MPISNQVKNQHLMWRAGFGPDARQLNVLQSLTPEELYHQLVQQSSSNPRVIDVANPRLKELFSAPMEARNVSEEERRAIRRQNREDLKRLNLTWLSEMVASPAQLREKMAFFWHGHFACRNMNIFYQQALLDVIRKDALGNFGDLLRNVSKSAAMLNFLNNNQNRKGHPNENFAREVMELFTIGRGQYTEQDVKEAARAFTGWGANARGEFVFRKQLHDTDSKTVFGKTGNFDGDRIINMLLDRKETAIFITRKIWLFFVSESQDQQKISWLSDRFYRSGYDINKLMNDIFLSDWFYQPAYIGSRIKSPVELLAGLRRTLPMQFENEDIQLVVQRILGQVLFYPPNVAGWAGDKNWIDSSSLMFRLRIPQLIKDAGEIQLKPKEDDDQTMGMKEEAVARKQGGARIAMGRRNGTQIKAALDWTNYVTHFNAVPAARLRHEISNFILQTPQKISEKVVTAYADASHREQFIKTLTIQLMSTPEYQLC